VIVPPYSPASAVLPGLIITIFFIFLPLGIFLPREVQQRLDRHRSLERVDAGALHLAGSVDVVGWGLLTESANSKEPEDGNGGRRQKT